MHVNISSLRLQATKSGATSRALTIARNARLRAACARLSVMYCYAAIFYLLLDIYDLVSLIRSELALTRLDSI